MTRWTRCVNVARGWQSWPIDRMKKEKMMTENSRHLYLSTKLKYSVNNAINNVSINPFSLGLGFAILQFAEYIGLVSRSRSFCWYEQSCRTFFNSKPFTFICNGAAQRRRKKTPQIDVTLYENIYIYIYWQQSQHSSSGLSSVSFLFSPSFIRSTRSPPQWKSNKSADIDPVSSAGLISFQPEKDGYLQRSWQTIVFTIFFSQANKGGAVIASDYMKKRLMIPIYNSRLNNDTVKSWQAVINEGSYKTYLVWRMAGDELHSDTNSW